LKLLGIALAAILATVVPARAQSDWAQDLFRGMHNKPAPVPASLEPSKPRAGKGTRQSPASDAERDQEAQDAKDAKDAKKENVFVRPELPPGKGPWTWRILKTEWSQEDERGFEAFIVAIGESDCKTVHECMTSPLANPLFHRSNPPYAELRADCADLPGFLRGYYAWKNNLPFSFSIKYGAHPRAPGNRNGVTGNQITERYDIIGPGPDGRLALPVIGQYVSTEHFRVPPAYAGKLLPDYYPVKLTRESIRPGTVIFDPDGHVAVVYKVSDNGLIHYIDAHPDNSLTRGIYGRDYARALPEMGAGFKRWRPQSLKGATRSPDGTLIGGRIELKRDSELADWSDEQFYGNVAPRPKLWSDGKFEIGGRELDYYDYLRVSLAGAGFKYDPLEETRTRMRSLCEDLKERVAAVDLAVRAGYPRKPQPPRLPNNIYATTGEWEVYSTPSRDARLKTSFEELRDEIERFLDMSREDASLLNYSGKDLRASLRHIYETEAAECTFSYTRTNGALRQMNFTEAMHRLFRMSFDPYHCVELRWGASSTEELSTCQDGADKRAWYQAQERLRNQTVRTYGEPMGWTLAQLQDPKADIGTTDVPDIDVVKLLDREEGADSAASASPAKPAAVASRARGGRRPPTSSGNRPSGQHGARTGSHRLLVPTGHSP
jgi:hypothetical protein